MAFVNKIKVLIVDDSAVIQKILSSGLSVYSEIEVVGTAANAYEARDLILETEPDVMTLDVEMPYMNGVDFLKKLMPQYPIPVIMVSSLTDNSSRITFEALESGAVDYILKPSGADDKEIQWLIEELRQKIHIASGIDIQHWQNKLFRPKSRISKVSKADQSKGLILAIGASTGGTTATNSIISALPEDTPGTVIVQHMPPVFTRMYAERLNRTSKLDVKEAVNGDIVQTGRVLIAPGSMQMELQRKGNTYFVKCYEGEKVNGFQPSVDVLFYSVSKSAGKDSIGVILTGMGNDGAKGMLAMKLSGASTLAQDESSSVVYGMPREAYLNGGAQKIVSLKDMPSQILQSVHEKSFSK